VAPDAECPQGHAYDDSPGIVQFGLNYAFTGYVLGRISVASIEQDQEREVTSVMFSVGAASNGAVGSFRCEACARPGSYVGRAWIGEVLIGEGFYRVAGST